MFPRVWDFLLIYLFLNRQTRQKSKQRRNILQDYGTGEMWNNGLGVENEVPKMMGNILRDQDIVVWQYERSLSCSLCLYTSVKETWREWILFKVNLKKRN
jgi:hypothetical protein